MNRLLVVLIIIVAVALFLHNLPGRSADKGHFSYGI